MSQVIIYASDNRLSLEGLQNTRTSELIASATVTATIISRAGTPLSQPIIMTPVAGKPGSYDGILVIELNLALDQFYTVRVYVDGGPGLRRTFEDVAQVKRI